jgi:hypothetical protein
MNASIGPGWTPIRPASQPPSGDADLAELRDSDASLLVVLSQGLISNFACGKRVLSGDL